MHSVQAHNHQITSGGTGILLNEIESKKLVSQAGIEIIEAELATTRKEAIAIARRIGFPVVLKIVSPDIIHKSDAGGVQLNIKNVSETGRAYSQIMAAAREAYPQARIEGISVQKMAPPGTEVIMGVSRDAQFGPVIMFGLGGVFVELLKDVSLRIAPIKRRDASQMISEIKGYPLLTGYRGGKAVSMEALEDSLLKLSSFIENKPMIKELDLNPMFAYSDRVVAADARVILESRID